MYVPHERRALILRLLEQRGYLRAAELAQELGVTEETIRTDLIALQERKLLTRVHGGARYIPPTGGAEDATRLDCQFADRILRHLQPGCCLYLDPGAAAQALVQRLGDMPCTIITASLRLLSALSAKALPQRLVVPGGVLDKESGFISCEQAAAFFRRYTPDTAVLLPPAIPTTGGIAYHRATRASWAAAAARAATRTIVAAPAQAFYTTAEHTAACKPHLLIAEDNLPPGFDPAAVELVPYISAADLQPQDDISLR